MSLVPMRSSSPPLRDQSVYNRGGGVRGAQESENGCRAGARLEELPAEVLVQCFAPLPFESLFGLARMCRWLHEVVHGNDLFKAKFAEAFSVLCAVPHVFESSAFRNVTERAEQQEKFRAVISQYTRVGKVSMAPTRLRTLRLLMDDVDWHLEYLCKSFEESHHLMWSGVRACFAVCLFACVLCFLRCACAFP